jgi:hypothetical protein
MELPEEVYEEELIDAFDAPQMEAPAPSASSLYEHSNLGQSTRPRVQAVRTTLYPTFDAAPPAREAPAVAALAALKLPEPHSVPPTSQAHRQDELMSGQELQRRRQQIEHEMRVYQERFDHVAQALAGDTPHQLEERKKREEERLERQEKRHEATATRLEHQVERLEEREERRARILARHHRASRSPSPGSGCDEEVGRGIHEEK